MKIIVHGPRAGYGPGGMIDSWAPDQPVDIDDADKKAVAWARMFIATGAATLVEDVAAKAPRASSRQASTPAAN